MVCVPCFIIPVLLYVWHRFLQPVMLRYWNPWAVRDADGNVTDNAPPKFPFECAGGQCPFPAGRKTEAVGVGAAAAPEDGAAGAEPAAAVETTAAVDKKRD